MGHEDNNEGDDGLDRLSMLGSSLLAILQASTLALAHTLLTSVRAMKSLQVDVPSILRMNIILQHHGTVARALPWNSVLVEHVNLLERKTFRLGDAEICEDEASNTACTPDEEHLCAEVGGFDSRGAGGGWIDEVGSGVTNAEVPEPVGGGSHGHGFGTDLKRIDLSSDDPCDGTPSRSEERDVDADEGDENLLASLIVDRDGYTNDSDEELADEHTSRTPQKQTTTTNAINGEDTRNSHTDVDDIGGDGDQEWVRDA